MSKLPANLSSLLGNLQTAQQATPLDSSGDFLYLKMNKQGEWVYGAEDTEVADDSAFVIDPNSYAQGFVAWYDGDLIMEEMAVAGQPPKTLADLPALPDMPKTANDPKGCVWNAQVAFALKGIEGAEEGLQLLYKVSSKGGKGAIAELLGKIIERIKGGHADSCPVVFLKNSHYKHKKFGKIYTPSLDVDEWIDLPDPDEEPVAAKPKAVAKPEPIVEDEPEPEPAPKGRQKRSRRAA